MAVPFLSTLSRSALAAYPFVLRGTRGGLSSRAITTSLADAGIRVSRTQTVLPLMRKIREFERVSSRLRFVSGNARYDLARLPTALTRQRKAYSFTVRALVQAKDGPAFERFLQVGFDEGPITPNMVKTAAEEALQRVAEYEVTSVMQLVVEGGSVQA